MYTQNINEIYMCIVLKNFNNSISIFSGVLERNTSAKTQNVCDVKTWCCLDTRSIAFNICQNKHMVIKTLDLDLNIVGVSSISV